MFSENVTCPKCGHESPAGFHECVRCGLIFAKYQELLQRKGKDGRETGAQGQELEVDAAAADKPEDISPESVKDPIEGQGADPASAETADDGHSSAGEVEVTVDDKPLDAHAINGVASKSDPEDEPPREADEMAATQTPTAADASEFSKATAVQALPQASTETEIELSAAEDQKAGSAWRAAADTEPQAERDTLSQPNGIRPTGYRQDVAEATSPVAASQSDSIPVQASQSQSSGSETETPTGPGSTETNIAGRVGAESESVSDEDEVLVLVDLLPEDAAVSATAQADGGKDRSDTGPTKPEPEPPKKVKPLRSVVPPPSVERSPDPKQPPPRDWRSKLKHAMATRQDLKDIIRGYEGQSIAINYYDSTQIQEAELISVNNLFFSAFVKNQNLLYSFPLHTVISVAEKIENGPGGKPASATKFPAVITISPPSYL